MSSFVGVDESLNKKPGKRSFDEDELNNLFKMSYPQSGIVELSIDSLTERKNHRWSRLTGEKEKLVRESIKEFGVMQPIVVRPQKSIAYKIEGDYEILAGHNRVRLSKEVGLSKVPAIIKEGLTEAEAEHYVNHTNIGRDWNEMKYSERAAVLASEYNAQKISNVRKEVLDEINSYLKSYENPVNSMDGEGVSHGETKSVRDIADTHDLSGASIARYIRIDVLTEDLKLLLDEGRIPFLAAVELSYIDSDNQEVFVSLIRNNEYKCDKDKAKMIRGLQKNGQLTIATMTDILSGKKKKRGRPKDYKVSSKVIQKYFKDENDEKKIGEIIEEALKMYFGE